MSRRSSGPLGQIVSGGEGKEGACAGLALGQAVRDSLGCLTAASRVPRTEGKMLTLCLEPVDQEWGAASSSNHIIVSGVGELLGFWGDFSLRGGLASQVEPSPLSLYGAGSGGEDGF